MGVRRSLSGWKAGQLCVGQRTTPLVFRIESTLRTRPCESSSMQDNTRVIEKSANMTS